MGRAYEYWLQSQQDRHDGAPDIRVLWDKRPVARKTHRCGLCGEEIMIGARYSSVGLIEDGLFRAEKTHEGAYHYPSGCPAVGARDRAEAEEQFRKDEALFGDPA